MQSTSKKGDFVMQDLSMIQDTIEALTEVLEREDFDNYDAGDAYELCEQIEELAIAIKKGVEQK
jgi:hypothetical protein